MAVTLASLPELKPHRWTLPRALDARVVQTPDRPFVATEGEGTQTFAHCRAAAFSMAGVLRAAGVCAGDLVAVMAPNGSVAISPRRFLERAIDLHGVPEKITIDKSGANTAAIVSIQADSGLPIEMRQSKYLNNIVEQDHRAIKRIVRPMMGFKSFACARILLAGIETMHMIRKGQLECPKDQASSAANQFYSLAF